MPTAVNIAARQTAAGVSAGAGVRSISCGLAACRRTSRGDDLRFAGVALAPGHSRRHRSVRYPIWWLPCVTPRRRWPGAKQYTAKDLDAVFLDNYGWSETLGREWSLGERADRLRLSDFGPVHPLSPAPSRSRGNVLAAERHGSLATR